MKKTNQRQRKKQGISFILASYIQFSVAKILHDYYACPASALLLLISIFLIFGLSLKGLMILFSDKKYSKH